MKTNKILTNFPVLLSPEEVENLSQTLSAVRTAGGGSEPGKTYIGDNEYILVDNIQNPGIITLRQETQEKINNIPTKVTDLEDYANYQTVAGMDDYLTKTSATENLAPLSVTADVDTLKSSSGDWLKESDLNDYATKEYANNASANALSQAETWVESQNYLKEVPNTYATKTDLNTASSTLIGVDNELSGHIDYVSAHAITSLDNYYTKTQVDSTFASATQLNNYLTTAQYQTDSATFALKSEIPTTVAQLTDSGNYYQKTETSGISELNTAFESKQDNLTQEQLSAISSVSSIKGTVLVGDSNILAASADDGNNIKWTLELTAQPTVTDTTLSGYDGIVATKDSSVSSRWNVGIAQAYKEQIEAVSSKLTQDDADTLYAPISVTGDVDTLKSSSGDWNEVSAKLDTSAFSSVSGKFISASQPFTANLGGGSKLTVIDGATAVFNSYNSFSSIYNNLIQGINNSYTGGNNFAQGTSNKVDGTSFAHGASNYAKNTSIVQGNINSATDCSQAFGDGNVITNTGMAIGKYNKTSSDVSFVIGNGTNSNRSDLFIIKHDGTVSSTGDFIVDGKSLSSVYYTVSTNSGDWLKASDLNNYITTAQYATDSATFVTSSNSTITGTKQYALTTAGWAEVSTPTIPAITAESGISADGYKIGLTTTAINAITSVSSKVDKPDSSLINKYLVLRTDGTGNVSGWSDFQDQSYSKSEAQGTFVHRDMLDNGTNGTLSGTGITGGSILGINTDIIQTKLTNEQLSAISSVSSKLDTSALTVNTANNAITLATGPSTSASVSAVSYKRNYSEAAIVPQRIVVALDDQDIINHIGYYSDNQYGTIIFVTSAHT